jgi:Formate/nitrite transporter
MGCLGVVFVSRSLVAYACTNVLFYSKTHPTVCFVFCLLIPTTGLEHSIANLFMLPLALMLGAPLTVGAIIFKNLIPVIIGNGVAGAFIVAASYSYQFGRLGGLRRAVFAEKLANIQKELALKRKAMDMAQLEQQRQALTSPRKSWY